MTKVGREKTMRTIFQITGKKTLRALFTMPQTNTPKRVGRKAAFIAQLIFVGPEIIKLIAVMRGIVTIHTVLFPMTTEGKIAVLIFKRVIAKIAIY